MSMCYHSLPFFFFLLLQASLNKGVIISSPTMDPHILSQDAKRAKYRSVFRTAEGLRVNPGASCRAPAHPRQPDTPPPAPPRSLGRPCGECGEDQQQELAEPLHGPAPPRSSVGLAAALPLCTTHPQAPKWPARGQGAVTVDGRSSLPGSRCRCLDTQGGQRRVSSLGVEVAGCGGGRHQACRHLEARRALRPGRSEHRGSTSVTVLLFLGNPGTQQVRPEKT
ncbi:uncharacterized protein LOC121040764 [Herpailurus yagouaroundi]|uniref:uncharacterized protein LOC121040764 n=1 Tax=Herpailurus yagouaroundi TaxID=1608482 RepID=UPI001AD7070B|nr:uncharacterized protein LOC121040764 [Puma yagouaroundi]